MEIAINKFKSNARRVLLTASIAGLLPGIASAASLDVYISSPIQQSTFVQDARTETFDSLTANTPITGTYNSNVGTYTFTDAAQVVGANEFGGADGTNYISIGAQSGTTTPYTLNLKSEANYFGFWWSAGDGENGVSLYYDDIFLARFSTKDILTLLENPSVTAVDGTVYDSTEYFGNPNILDGENNSSQPYAYVNIFSNGLKFNKIIFDNSNTTSTGFETDNHSMFNGSSTPVPEDSSVFVQELPPQAVPEPGATTLLLIAGAGLLYRMARSRKAARA